MKLSRAADTIVVGNPLIADAAVKDAKTIVITGKGFGVTNFVVLDAKGDPIVDEQVIVSRSVAETIGFTAGRMYKPCRAHLSARAHTRAKQRSKRNRKPPPRTTEPQIRRTWFKSR